MALYKPVALHLATSAIAACISGKSANPPIDLTIKHTHNLCYAKVCHKIQISSPDYSERKPCTIQITMLKGHILEIVIISNEFPDQYARSPTDKFSYSDLPVVHQFKQIEVRVGNAVTESLTPHVIITRLREYFYNNYDQKVDEWLGGSSETNHWMQKYEGFNGVNFNYTNYDKNVIKKAYKWFFPIVCHLFLNEDKFKYSLVQHSLLEFTLNFQTIKNFTNRSENIQLTDISGSLDIWVVAAVANDFRMFYNNLPYLYPTQDEHYYVHEEYVELSDKKFNGNQDYKLQIKMGPTTKIECHYNDLTFSNNNKFYGETVKKSIQNFIASHITPNIKQTSSQTINLVTGLFQVNGLNTTGPWVIENWTTGGKMFRLRYIKNNTQSYTVTIYCNTPFSDLGELYFDLGTFQNDNKIITPQLIFLKSFRLNIIPYINVDNIYSQMEEPSVVNGTSTMLVDGYFTFKNDPATSKNLYAFWSVDDIEKSLACDELLLYFAFSLPVTTTPNTASVFASKKYVIINYPHWKWYDLDKKYPVKLNEVLFERTNGMNDPTEKELLMLYDDIFEKKDNNSPFFKYVFSYYIYKKNVLYDTKGFLDTQLGDFNQYQIKLETQPLIFDGQQISDTLKEIITDNRQLSFNSVQFLLRTLVYDGNTQSLRKIENEERKFLNYELTTKILKDAGLYVANDVEPPTKKMKGIRTDPNSVNNSYLGEYPVSGQYYQNNFSEALSQPWN